MFTLESWIQFERHVFPRIISKIGRYDFSSFWQQYYFVFFSITPNVLQMYITLKRLHVIGIIRIDETISIFFFFNFRTLKSSIRVITWSHWALNSPRILVKQRLSYGCLQVPLVWNAKVYIIHFPKYIFLVTNSADVSLFFFWTMLEIVLRERHNLVVLQRRQRTVMVSTVLLFFQQF